MTTATLEFYTGLTLVDITQTGVTRDIKNTSDSERNQQRNWESVLQAMGLRTQPLMVQGPRKITTPLDDLHFGEMYTGTHNVWIWTFGIEHPGIYGVDTNPTAQLEYDFNQVPIITGLTETAKFMLPIFYCSGPIKNVYFINKHIDVNTI